MVNIALDEVFNIVKVKDKKGNDIYRLQFKNDLTFLKNHGMSTNEYTCQTLGYRWINKNRADAHNRIFELNVLVETP